MTYTTRYSDLSTCQITEEGLITRTMKKSIMMPRLTFDLPEKIFYRITSPVLGPGSFPIPTNTSEEDFLANCGGYIP